MNKSVTVTMGKKTYRKPQMEMLQVETTSILAASGEGKIKGTGSDMGWDNGSNAKQNNSWGDIWEEE